MNKYFNKNYLPYVLIAILSSLSTVFAYKFIGLDKKDVIFSESKGGPTQFTNSPNSVPLNEFTYAAEKAVDAVVHIQVKGSAPSSRRQSMDPFEDFFNFGFPKGGGNSRPQEGSGSGVIISSEGYIVTNNHVIANAEEIEVIMNDKRVFKAKKIGADPNTDVAIIQITSSNLPSLPFGNSDELRLGEWVLAVGNPFNLESTVTAGIVSAKGRSINILEGDSPVESFIQTDAAVNPGNSGGALVNLKGELVGINTAISSKTGQFAGISYAVPASIVKKVANDLLKFGTVQRGYLGIRSLTVDGKVADKLDLKINKGIYVSEFTEGSAAKGAGIKIGDVITKVEDTEVTNSSKLIESIARYKPGDKIRITVNRAGTEKEIVVTLKKVDTSNSSSSIINETLGAKIGDVSEEEKGKLKIQGGAKVVQLSEGILDELGIREGFIITKLGDQNVKSAKDFIERFENSRGRLKIEGTYPNQPGSKYSYVY